MAYDSYTKLMLHFNSFPFIDEIGHTVTNNGHASLSTSIKKFGIGACAIDGALATNDLSLLDSNDFEFGANDFTIDLWVRFSSISTMGVEFVSHWAGGGNLGFQFGYYAPLSSLYFASTPDGSSQLALFATWTPSLDTWYHVALVRSGTNLMFFVNGIQQGSTQTLSYSIYNANCEISLLSDLGDTRFALDGYCDEFRISNGIARWTSNFVPPSIEYGASYPASNVIILEETFKNISVYGNCGYDITNKKLGNASLYFPGSNGDYISTTANNAFNFLTDDFTIDFFMKDNGSTYLATLMGQGGIGVDSDTSFVIRKGAAGVLEMAYYNGSTLSTIDSVSNVFDGTFHHIAIVRDGNNLLLFVDGTLETTKDITGFSFSTSTTEFAVGRKGNLDANYFLGNIDEVRISKGIARWTATFTPTTTEYIVDMYTFFLLHMDAPQAGTGVSKFQGSIATLAPDESFVITHIADPANTRLIQVMQPAGNWDALDYTPGNEFKYTYDDDIIEFISDGARIKAISSGVYPIGLYNIKTNVLSRIDTSDYSTLQAINLFFMDWEWSIDALFVLLSFDGGVTWKTYDFVGHTWSTVSESTQGMVAENLRSLMTPHIMAEVFVPGSLDIIMQLKSDGTGTATLQFIETSYSIPGYMPIDTLNIQAYMISPTQTKIKNVTRQSASFVTFYNVLATIVI